MIAALALCGFILLTGYRIHIITENATLFPNHQTDWNKP